VLLLRGVGPHSHPRTESSGVGWGGPGPTCWLVALGALARGACAGEDREVLAAGDGVAESRPCSPVMALSVRRLPRPARWREGPGAFTSVHVPPAPAAPATHIVWLESALRVRVA
jgi:hypothetical protein